MSLDFTAIDFETANSSRASVCAVGLVKVRDGRIADQAGGLVRPPDGHDEFHWANIEVHGITADMVAGAPPWRRVGPWLQSYVGDDVLIAHNAPFDMSVLRYACAAEGLPVPAVDYLCTLALARRMCDMPSRRLPDVAAEFGVLLARHHEASADARCAAEIAVAMARRHGYDKVEQLAQSYDVPVRRLG
ncbi:MAG: 3'-5' exonuclease [Streptosporangiales bacterium]|nr:3'-5' exonuclease [Streptosporangiales bacterium]